MKGEYYMMTVRDYMLRYNGLTQEEKKKQIIGNEKLVVKENNRILAKIGDDLIEFGKLGH